MIAEWTLAAVNFSVLRRPGLFCSAVVC